MRGNELAEAQIYNKEKNNGIKIETFMGILYSQKSYGKKINHCIWNKRERQQEQLLPGKSQ